MANNTLLTEEFINGELARGVRQGYLDWIESLWQQFEPYAPRDFPQNFRNDKPSYYSLTWEIFLASILLDNGFVLDKLRSSDAPDLCVLDDNGNNVWFECYYATRGQKLPCLPTLSENNGMSSQVTQEHSDKNLLRVTMNLDGKKQQHLNWINKDICKTNEPYVIAINGRDLDLHMSHNNLPDAARAVYPMGEPVGYFYPDDRPFEIDYPRVDFIKGPKGGPVSKTFFLDQKNSHISGILFSKDWWGYGTTAPKNVYIPNIYADNPCTLDLSNFAQIINGGRDPDYISTYE